MVEKLSLKLLQLGVDERYTLEEEVLNPWECMNILILCGEDVKKVTSVLKAIESCGEQQR